MPAVQKAVTYLDIDIFCRVIDNFGDAGVMWRLARALRAEGYAVRLIIDDPTTLCALAGCDSHTPIEKIGSNESIEVCLWEKDWDTASCPLLPASVVIEGFACRLPSDYQAKMAKTSPAWFNIDYFSAEDWIENCHLVPSIDPSSGLIKTNYFPGVTEKSGGLIIEKDYEHNRHRLIFGSGFKADEKDYEHNRHLFLMKQPKDTNTLRVLFFAYPYGPIEKIAQALCEAKRSIELSVTQCEAGQLLAQAVSKQINSRVTVNSLPFVSQKDFDHLLWSSDIVFIRGEDSAARAMIAGVPFLWHIYHQDDDVHMLKLRALEGRFENCFEDKALFKKWSQLQEAMNEGEFDPDIFSDLIDGLDQWKKASECFSKKIKAIGSLAEKLSEQIKKI